MKQPFDNLRDARTRLESGDVQGAEAALEGLSHPEALAMRARIRCDQGDHLEAARLYRAILAEAPSAEAYYRLGTCWQHLSQWESSEKALIRAVTLDPRHTDAFILLGIAFYQQERYPDAVKALERALINDPRALLARYHLAQVCMELGNLKRALSQLHVLQGLQPDYAPTHRLQAGIFLKLKDYRQALVELCWLVEAGHADVWCFSSMGTAYRAIGEKVQSLRAVEFALRLDPSLIDETLMAAQLNEELEQYEMALDFYRTLLRDLQWGETARVAVERLERRVAVIKLAAKPSSDLPEFAGFQAPAVTQQGTLPLPGPDRVPTQPLGMQDIEYEGPAPLLDRLKRNLTDLTGGKLDLDALKDRSQEVLEKIPLDALKEKLPDALSKLPLKRLFGNRRT
ncbi:tetratricopeptide repeat protein [compost metagenome]